MCLTPGRIRLKDREVDVACRNCEECRRARLRSWTGRILAEMQTAADTWFVTLTYGGGYDAEVAYRLDYRDVQLFLKRLRKDGFRFRFVAVGEYGGKRNRAHWHLMIFWEDRVPTVPMNERFNWQWWSWGLAQCERPRSGQASAAYIMQYLDKDAIDARMKFSTRPALGTQYLLEYARRHAREGVALFAAGNVFTIPGNTRSNGKLFYYPVEKDRSIYTAMIRAYLLEWSKFRPESPAAMSADVAEYVCGFEGEGEEPEELGKAFAAWWAKHYQVTTTQELLLSFWQPIDDDPRFRAVSTRGALFVHFERDGRRYAETWRALDGSDANVRDERRNQALAEDLCDELRRELERRGMWRAP